MSICLFQLATKMKRLTGEAELFTEHTVQLQPEVLNRVNKILGKQTVTITLLHYCFAKTLDSVTWSKGIHGVI